MSDREFFEYGSKPKLTGTFVDHDNSDAPFDPETVYLTIEKPDGTFETFEYDSGDETIIDKVSTGVYRRYHYVDQDGEWVARFWSPSDDAVGTASDVVLFDVRPARGIDPNA